MAVWRPFSRWSSAVKKMLTSIPRQAALIRQSLIAQSPVAETPLSWYELGLLTQY